MPQHDVDLPRPERVPGLPSALGDGHRVSQRLDDLGQVAVARTIPFNDEQVPPLTTHDATSPVGRTNPAQVGHS